MCRGVSLLVTKYNVLFNPPEFGESHEVIMKRNHIINDLREIRGVAVEITPPLDNFSIPFDKWVFKVDQDLLPDWWNAEEAEIACRAKLPEWFKSHCVKKDTIIEKDGFYIMTHFSPNVTMNGGKCYVCGIISPNIKIYNGECYTFNQSCPVIDIYGGYCFTYNDSAPVVRVRNRAFCGVYGNSSPTVILYGGICNVYNKKSSPTIYIHPTCICNIYDGALPIIKIKEGGVCNIFSENSSPEIEYIE